MAVAVVLGTAFFALLPRRTHFWTHFGQYTMYVYLLHSFVLYPFRESGLLRELDPTWLWLPIVVAASVLIALGAGDQARAARVPAARRAAPGMAVRRPDARRARGAPQRPDRLASPARQPRRPRLRPDPRQNG